MVKRKSKSNVYMNGSEAARRPEIIRDLGTNVRAPLNYWKAVFGSGMIICKAVRKLRACQSKSKLDKTFDRIIRNFLGLILRGELGNILCLNPSNVCIKGAEFSWRRMVDVGM